MFQVITLALVFAVLNRLRGWEWGKPYTSKGMTSAVSGAVAGGCAFWLGCGPVVARVVAVIVFLGIWIWAIPGHGRYFASFHGRDTTREREVTLIDWIGEV